ncbi:hypothetical protein F5X99DRAFT_371334 [Biscogniauxia marginata]|nr:hypothetical protein F5X99DRAFT_371334 [Biscogniauxia marginata]
MAELVGLVASIGGIASAGLAVAKTIATLADELGSAGTQIKAISTDTKAVALILHELRRRLNKSTKINRQAFEVANEIADLCKVDIDNIKQCLLPISPSDNEKMDIAKKARWLLAKSKIAMRRTSLDSLKLTLTLFLHTLDFIEGDVIDEGYIQDEVEELVTQSKNTKTRFLNAERTDQYLEKVYDSAQFFGQLGNKSNNDEYGMGDTQKLLHCNTERNIEEELAMVLRRIPVNDYQDSETGVLDSLQTTEDQMSKRKPSEFDIMESLPDDHFLRIAQHIRTQKVVTSYALVVLEQSPYKDVSTTTATATSNSPLENTPTSRVEVPSDRSPKATTKDSVGIGSSSVRFQESSTPRSRQENISHKMPPGQQSYNFNGNGPYDVLPEVPGRQLILAKIESMQKKEAEAAQMEHEARPREIGLEHKREQKRQSKLLPINSDTRANFP